MWAAYSAHGGEIHVIPVDDLRPHVRDRRCWCRPEEDAGDGIWAHNSLDGRERIEVGHKPS